MPPYPQKINASDLSILLLKSESPVSLRTVQRDLSLLSEKFPQLKVDKRDRIWGYSLKPSHLQLKVQANIICLDYAFNI
jgi:hypothetical protein